MPIGNITQSVSVIPAPPHRGVDVQTVFVTKQEDFQDHLQGTTVTELNTLKDQLNLRIGEINSTATTMNGYANTASAGASTATTKAGEASTSAGEALSYKNQAETFKNNASASATKASQWSDNNYNVEVEAGKYSAKHWSVVAQNATANKVDKVTSTDNAIVRFDGVTGQVQNSGVTIDDSGNIGSGTQSFKGFGGTGFKNYIINGNFNIWEYGITQESSIDGIDGYGSDNRWFNQYASSYRKHTRQLATDAERLLFNAPYFSRTIVATAGNANSIALKKQHIEDVTRLAGKTVTLSFWAKADSNKNIAMEVVQVFGYGGSPSAILDKQCVTTIPLTSIWQKKTITFTIPSIIGKTLGTDGVHTSYTQIRFWLDAGSTFNANTNSLGNQSGTFDIAQVQLEEGTIATPFEQRPYGLELSLCQRYYEIADSALQGYAGVNGEIWAYRQNLKVSKRATPTLITKSYTQSNCILSAPANGLHDTFSFSSTAISAGAFSGTLQVTASAEL